MPARIYRPAPNAMQSGKGRSAEWVVEFESDVARRIDPLMGYSGVADTSYQVKLSFDTREDAIAYCQRQNIAFEVADARTPKRVIKSYAENFTSNRKRPWTH